MFPGMRVAIHSVVTRFEPPSHLEEDFAGAGMTGHLAYEFLPEDGGTRLAQHEQVAAHGWLRPLTPFIRATLAPRLQSRLEGIKAVLDRGWPVTA